MKTNALIIDDEPNAIKSLQSKIENNLPNIEIVDTCHSGEAGYQSILKNKPDVVFLDVDMPKMNGFEMLQKFNEINFHVIFCTGFDKYAIQAFRISQVVDYLLKPVQTSQLIEAYNRVLTRGYKDLDPAHLKILIENNAQLQLFTIRSSEGKTYVKTNNIIYFQSSGHLITAKLEGERKSISFTTNTLSNIEKSLPQNEFCRVHQSSIVSISKIENYNKGKQTLTMSNNDILKVSRNCKPLLEMKLEKFSIL